MPLTHSHHDFFFADNLTFHIPMRDRETARSIRVSTATVLDLAARDGRQADNVTDLMAHYRSVIEDAAVKKYSVNLPDGPLDVGIDDMMK
jgi:hypothetical protein